MCFTVYEATLSASQQQDRTLKGQKQTKLAVRNVLISPYTCKWPELKESSHEEITKKLHLTFASLNLTRVKGPWIRDKDENKRKLKKQKHEKEKKNSEDPRIMNLRGQLAVGLNCTARCLERGTLRVVLVDRNTQPAILTRHLVPSAAVNKCPILFINQLARTLAPELGISSLCALGIKKLSKGDESDLNELVEFLASQAVPIDIPWLKCEQNTDPNQHTKSDGTTEPGHNCNADPVLKADPNENADPNGTGPRLQTVTKEESVIEQLHASLMKNKPIDFDKIYVQKSSSELTDGKIKPFEFGSVGFVEFDASSDDEFIVCRRKGETNRAGKRKKKSKGVKRKSTNEPVYETARIGKIRNNEDRSSVKYKKKKK